MSESSADPTPPPYRPNLKGKIGFILSLVCLGLFIIVTYWYNFGLEASEVMKICLVVMMVFIILLSLFGLILSAGAIKGYPKVFAIIGTIISGITLVNTLFLLLSISLVSYSDILVY